MNPKSFRGETSKDAAADPEGHVHRARAAGRAGWGPEAAPHLQDEGGAGEALEDKGGGVWEAV